MQKKKSHQSECPRIPGGERVDAHMNADGMVTENENENASAAVHFTFPLCASHNLMVLSSLPLASMVPSGLHVTDLIQSECPLTGLVGLASSE